MSVFLEFLCDFFLSRFLSDGSKKTPQKGVKKNIASKSFLKKIDKKRTKTDFSRFVLSRFWAFLDSSGEWSSKTRQKISGNRKINLTPVLFWPLTPDSAQ
jgi:hypothetical protein